jgi:ribulose-phosphate 3-epimerase
MKHLIAPSILSADFGNLERDIKMLNNSNADWIHCDIMDGVFVPNISFGFPVVESVKKNATKPLDVHLMIVNPDQYIQRFAEIGASTITVHYEACPHLHRTVQVIKVNKCAAGVSLNPHTPVEVLEDIIIDLDMVLLMTVNPGFGGQKFIENSYNRIVRLKKMIERRGAKTLIEVDGGVDLSNAAKLVAAGVDVLVAGSFVFNSPNPTEIIQKLKNCC